MFIVVPFKGTWLEQTFIKPVLKVKLKRDAAPVQPPVPACASKIGCKGTAFHADRLLASVLLLIIYGFLTTCVF